MRRHVLLIAMLLAMTSLVSAQQRQITGKVKGGDGKPVSFATIQVKGTSNGAAADEKGNFKLNIPGNNEVLVIRSVGYTTKEIPAGSNSYLEVTLTADETNLQEVVVTGLGIQRSKKALGYAVQDVKGDELTKAGQSDALRGLSGKVAGVQITAFFGYAGSGYLH